MTGAVPHVEWLDAEQHGPGWDVYLVSNGGAAPYITHPELDAALEQWREAARDAGPPPWGRS